MSNKWDKKIEEEYENMKNFFWVPDGTENNVTIRGMRLPFDNIDVVRKGDTDLGISYYGPLWIWRDYRFTPQEEANIRNILSNSSDFMVLRGTNIRSINSDAVGEHSIFSDILQQSNIKSEKIYYEYVILKKSRITYVTRYNDCYDISTKERFYLVNPSTDELNNQLSGMSTVVHFEDFNKFNRYELN